MKAGPQIGGGVSARVYRHPLLSGISGFLQCLALAVDPAKRRVRWTPLAASTAAVLMALDEDASLTGRFQHLRWCMKVDYSRRRRTGHTYNGLLKALKRQEKITLPLVKQELRRHVQQRLQTMDRLGSWVLLAVDGSKEELPRTHDHEKTFGIADNGISPQAFVTAIVEVGTGLPWDWRIGEARASEKDQFLEMIPALPSQALLLADANFVGLPIWEKLCAKEQPFLIRVGGNVHLLTDLWPDAQLRQERGIVYVWPKPKRKDHAPLKLRLIKIGSGTRAVHLLTNVLETTSLSKKAAGTIYRQRWGVELFYRTLKRTLGCFKLRSKAAHQARLELEWTLIALTITTLLGIDAVSKRRRDPSRLSPAALIRTLRDALRRQAVEGPSAWADLHKALGQCLKDSYQRKAAKSSRCRVRTANTPTACLRPPIIRKATAEEREKAGKYQQKTAA